MGWKQNIKGKIPPCFDFTFNMKLATIWRIVTRISSQTATVVCMFFRPDAREAISESYKLELETVLDKSTYVQNHNNSDFKDRVNLFMLMSKEVDEKEERINKNTKIFDMETEIHDGDTASTYV